MKHIKQYITETIREGDKNIIDEETYIKILFSYLKIEYIIIHRVQ